MLPRWSHHPWVLLLWLLVFLLLSTPSSAANTTTANTTTANTTTDNTTTDNIFTTSTSTTDDDLLVCDILVFVPFTYNLTEGAYFQTDSDTDSDQYNSLGFSHMAAAVLAVEHFNARNTAVVPELVQDFLKYENEKCNVQLNIRAVYDTGIMTHAATASLFRNILGDDRLDKNENFTSTTTTTTTTTTKEEEEEEEENRWNDRSLLPCALVGGYHDLPTQVLGMAAAGMQLPLTSYRSYNSRSADPYYTPFTTQVYPDQSTLAQVLVTFLQDELGRNDFIALLYKLGDTPVQLQQLVSLQLDKQKIQYRSYAYDLPSDPSELLLFDQQREVQEEEEDDDGSMPNAGNRLTELSRVAQRLKYEGFKTIVCMMEFPELEIDFIAQAAEDAGINSGEYVWILVGIDLSVFSLPPIDLSVNGFRLLAGSAIVTPLEGFENYAEDETNPDPFYQAWASLENETFVDHLNSFMTTNETLANDWNDQIDEVDFELLPIGFYQASPTYFQDFPPAAGAGFMYDAIMATGMGACHAEAKAKQRNINLASSATLLRGPAYLQGIRQANFTGATGRISFYGGGGITRNNTRSTTRALGGRRDTSRSRYGVVNIFELFAMAEEDRWIEMVDADSHLYSISHTLDRGAGADKWKQRRPFIFRNGEATAPLLLRTTPPQNYLRKGSRIGGLVLMSLVVVAGIASIAWIFVNRKQRIIKSSQPHFMYLICFGSCVEVLGIIPLSFDESFGLTDDNLDMCCMAVPWLFTSGYMITYGALFSKLWRVNRVLQFKRAVVKIKHVAWPSIALVVMALAVLVTMNIVDPLQWERLEIDSATGESIGRCQSDHFAAFLFTLATLMLIPTIMTAVMAWKTNDVNSEFAESFWIFILIVVQIEVIVVGIPVITVLRNFDTDARYWGVVLVLWTFPASTLSLLMIPKILAHRRLTNKKKPDHINTRGGRGGEVRITGLAGYSGEVRSSGPAFPKALEQSSTEILQHSVAPSGGQSASKASENSLPESANIPEASTNEQVWI